MVEGWLRDHYVLKLRKVHPSRPFPWITKVLELSAMPPIWQAQFPSHDGRWPGETGYSPLPPHQTDFTLPVAGAEPADGRESR
jgi:hypothetical protein